MMPLGAGYNAMPLWQNNIVLAHLQPCPSCLKISAAKEKKKQTKKTTPFCCKQPRQISSQVQNTVEYCQLGFI